jgi:chromosome segregation ATPase
MFCSSIGTRVVVVACLVGLVGCGSPSYKRTESKVDSLVSVRDEVEMGKHQIDVIAASLDGVVSGAGGDLRPSFDKYSKDLAKLESIAESARARAKALKDDSEAYFTAWQNELEAVHDPELRSQADERRAKAREQFSKIQDLAAKTRDAYEPYVKSLRDIKVVLGNDLNATGVESVKGTMATAKTSGKVVQERIATLAQELNAAIKAIDPKGTPAPKS